MDFRSFDNGFTKTAIRLGVYARIHTWYGELSCCFVSVDALRPNQLFFSHVRTFPGLNQE